MRSLDYCHLDQLILVAASKRPDCSITIAPQSFIVNFEEYVKSQLHLNVVTDLFHRNIFTYADAYDYCMTKNVSKEGCTLEVLKWFYQDLYNFLVHNPNNVVCIPQVSQDLFPQCKRTCIDYKQVRQSITAFIEQVTLQSAAEQLRTIQEFKYSEILDELENIEDLKCRIDNFTIAALLRQAVRAGEVVEWSNYD